MSITNYQELEKLMPGCLGRCQVPHNQEEHLSYLINGDDAYELAQKAKQLFNTYSELEESKGTDEDTAVAMAFFTTVMFAFELGYKVGIRVGAKNV